MNQIKELYELYIAVLEATDSTNKAWYNEFSDNTINVHIGEVWADSINSNPSQAVIDGVAELRTLFTLTLDNTVPNSALVTIPLGLKSVRGLPEASIPIS